ncbi:MAG: MptD family putative ECF transporter S component [Eubacteriales bacterium]
MNNQQKWGAKDVISVVLFSLILIVVQFAISTVTTVSMFASAVIAFALMGLFAAPIYFLMVSKINKRGVSLVYSLMLGSLYFFMGHWSTIFWFLFIGIVSEAILWKEDSCLDGKKITLAWILQAVLHIGVNVLSLIAFWDDYVITAQSQGMELDYINAYASYYQSPMWLSIIIVLTTVGAYVGTIMGRKMLKKHFEKAGVL